MTIINISSRLISSNIPDISAFYALFNNNFFPFIVRKFTSSPAIYIYYHICFRMVAVGAVMPRFSVLFFRQQAVFFYASF